MRRLLLGIVLLTALAVTSACSGAAPHTRAEDGSGGSPSRVAGAAHSASVPAGAPSRPVTKLLVVVVENHSLSQMRAQMPYTWTLARRFGYATSYSGVAYPSLPNYLAITSGSTHDVSDDNSPDQHPLAGASVFGEAVAAGKTAALYADGMPANCDQGADGGDDYRVKHNPWAYYPAERSLCQAHDVPATQLSRDAASGDLPNAGMLVPNMCHDAHDCDLSVADGWLEQTLGDVFTGPDWRSGHLAVVITADTDDKSEGNRVLTVVAHPSQHGNVVSTALDHYSLCRLYSQVTGTAPLNRAADATSMAAAFGLPLP